VAFFEGPLQHALHRLKYKRDIILADTLACLLRAGWAAYDFPGDVVIPIPLSTQRLRERGYNQAGLLARGFAELAGLTYLPRGVTRCRETRSQVGLSADQRRANVAGAFQSRPAHIAGKNIILVDDVCTTGATLAACAQALRSAGAQQVWGLTLGRAR
jgi:ComF family protein